MEVKRAKVHMLSTEKSILAKPKKEGFLQQFHKEIIESKHLMPYHLYFTTDEEIKEGDWYIGNEEEGNKLIQFKGRIIPIGFEKIIATTDPKLKIITGTVGNGTGIPLPQPSQAFIEKYCKVGGIDEVDVEYETLEDSMWVCNGCNQVKMSDMCTNCGCYDEHHPTYTKLKVDNHNTITIHPIKNSWSREEVVELVKKSYNKAFHETSEGQNGEYFTTSPNSLDEEWIEKNL